MPKKTTTNTPARENTRNPAFMLARIALINIMAREKLSTAEIAERLGVNRSYVIRLTSLSMEPTNGTERRIAKLCGEYTAQLVRMGMGFVTKDDIVTTLAGADGRGKGGGRPRKDAAPKPPKAPKAAPKAKAPKAKPPKAAKAPAPKTAPKPPKAAKTPKAKPAPKVKTTKPRPNVVKNPRAEGPQDTVRVLVTKPVSAAMGAQGATPLSDLANTLMGAPDPDTVLAPPVTLE